MSEAGEFVDAALQRESTWSRAEDHRSRVGDGLQVYGASVGAVRGAVRDAGRRYRGMTHDDITALSSELWALPVFERRLAAVVLLQSHVGQLRGTDLTRIEGFLRDAATPALADPLGVDVLGPLLERLDSRARAKANVVLDRWAVDSNPWLRRAAERVREDAARSLPVPEGT